MLQPWKQLSNHKFQNHNLLVLQHRIVVQILRLVQQQIHQLRQVIAPRQVIALQQVIHLQAEVEDQGEEDFNLEVVEVGHLHKAVVAVVAVRNKVLHLVAVAVHNKVLHLAAVEGHPKWMDQELSQGLPRPFQIHGKLNLKLRLKY